MVTQHRERVHQSRMDIAGSRRHQFCCGAQVHARSRPMADDVDLMQVAQDLPGLSGAALAAQGY